MNTIPEPENWKNMIPKLEAKESELKYKKYLSSDKALYTTNYRRGNSLNSSNNPKGSDKRGFGFKEISNVCHNKGYKQMYCWMAEKNKGKRPDCGKQSKNETANTILE
jgi:hypothetical protein